MVLSRALLRAGPLRGPVVLSLAGPMVRLRSGPMVRPGLRPVVLPLALPLAQSMVSVPHLRAGAVPGLNGRWTGAMTRTPTSRTWPS